MRIHKTPPASAAIPLTGFSKAFFYNPQRFRILYPGPLPDTGFQPSPQNQSGAAFLNKRPRDHAPPCGRPAGYRAKMAATSANGATLRAKTPWIYAIMVP